MRLSKQVLAGMAAILVILQCVPSKKISNDGDKSGDLINNGFARGSTASLIKTSCYDCHSLETKYPWYARVAPSSWLVRKDVNEGRSELNFSQWNSYSKREMIKHFENIKEQVQTREMPLGIYTLMHPKAKLTKEQREELVKWAETKSDSILGN